MSNVDRTSDVNLTPFAANQPILAANYTVAFGNIITILNELSNDGKRGVMAADPAGNPPAGNVFLYFKDVAGTIGLYMKESDGTVTQLNGAAGAVDADDVTYTPTTLTDWNADTDPGDVEQALDQLAERVDNLESSGGGAVDASGVTYTPTTAADWDGSADPGDVDNALDQLAERVADLEGAPSGSAPDYILIRDQKSQGTNGGTFTAGAWQTRVLNTEVTDTGNHASLASNQITLAAGTYRVHIKCPALGVVLHQAKLYNVTDAEDVPGCIGTPEFSPAAGSQTSSIITGQFTLAAPKVLEVQHRSTGTLATQGFGAAANLMTEVYTVVEFWKVA